MGLAQCIADPASDPNDVWLYCPSFAFATVFAILFGLVTAVHIFQAYTFRKSFCWVIVMTAPWETVGFSLRVPSTQQPDSTIFYIPQQILILLAPIWLNAFVYMVFGRMVWYFLPEQKVAGVKAGRLTLFFVLLDITAFLVQATGGSLLDSDDSSAIQLGLHIYMGGIGFQQAVLIGFVFLVVRFHRRVRHVENVRSTKRRLLLYTIYTSIVLITVRIIFRMVDFSQGFKSLVPSHEAFFYCLDAVPMLLAMYLYSIFHPGRFLMGVDSEFPNRKQKKEEKRQRKEEERQRKEEGKQIKAGHVMARRESPGPPLKAWTRT